MEKKIDSLMQRIQNEGRVHVNDVSNDMEKEADSLFFNRKIVIRLFDTDIYAKAHDVPQPYFIIKNN